MQNYALEDSTEIRVDYLNLYVSREGLVRREGDVNLPRGRTQCGAEYGVAGVGSAEARRSPQYGVHR